MLALQAEMPMLDEEEYMRVWALLGKGSSGDDREKKFQIFLKEYERITGHHETNPNQSFTIDYRCMVRPVRNAADHCEPRKQDSAVAAWLR